MHDDSEYVRVAEDYWEQVDNLSYLRTRLVYSKNSTKFYHYHIDPRFSDSNLYSHDDLNFHSFHSIIEGIEKPTYFKLECIREMPTQSELYKVFGPKFVEDYKDKEIKCGKCPHRGVNIQGLPVVDGKIICPAHGLKFDAKTKKSLILLD